MRLETISKRNAEDRGSIERMASWLTSTAERWVPDAFVFALAGTVIVVGAALAATSSTVSEVVDAWGNGFWALIPFTLQMALVIITGHVIATSDPAQRVIRAIAGWPQSPRAAVALVTVVALASSWINWGLSMVFSAMLALEVARRVPHVDYRALAAASFLGLGSIWAQGLSGSAALQMASPGALPPTIREIVAAGGLVHGGIIPLRHTIFLWQSVVSVLIEVIIVTALMWLATPKRGRSAQDLGIDLGDGSVHEPVPDWPGTPGTWLEHSRILTWLIVALGVTYLVRHFVTAPVPLNAITLDVINLAFLLTGMLLHQTPVRLMRAIRIATPAVWGVLLQFPFYAGIAGVITGTHLSEQLAHMFVRISTPLTFPAIVATYSAVLGVFVPSGGSKWVIEAPYVLGAAHGLQVHLGWVVASYDLGEALANLVQPFWMLPILGVFRLGARDVMGYTVLVFLVLFPIVILLVTLLGRTLAYPL
jgi:short-chain fatty acids transporter